MPDPIVCRACRTAKWPSVISDLTNKPYWRCPVINGGALAIDRKAKPPKGCHRILEQAMAAALTVNVDSDSIDPRTP